MFGVVVLWVVCGAFCLVFVVDWRFGVIVVVVGLGLWV